MTDQKQTSLKIEQILIDISEGEYASEHVDCEDLLVAGILDSFAFVELLAELEKQFKITISENEQLDQRLRSVNGLINFIDEKVL